MALPELVQPEPAREPNLREQTPTLCINANSTVLPASSVSNVYESIRKTKTSRKPCCDATPRNELSDAWPLHSRSSNGHRHPFRSFRTPSGRRRRLCEGQLPRPYLSQTPCGGALGSSQQRNSSNSRTLAQLPCRPARRLHRTHVPAIPAASRIRLTSDPTIDVQVGSAGGRCRYRTITSLASSEGTSILSAANPDGHLSFEALASSWPFCAVSKTKLDPYLLERNHALRMEETSYAEAERTSRNRPDAIKLATA
jgi:hypothetical protein